MELTTFVRKPFTVEAVEITTENIAEIAPMVGSLKNKDGEPYIQVDKKLVPNVFRVEPGYWLTKMGKNIRCYAPHIFKDQFVQSNDEIAAFVKTMNGPVPEPVE